MTSFILETYVAQLTPRELDDLAERARNATVGTSVTHIRSYFVPEDDMCMHVFDAPSAGAVEQVAATAGLEMERIVHSVGEHADTTPGRNP